MTLLRRLLSWLIRRPAPEPMEFQEPPLAKIWGDEPRSKRRIES